MLPHHRRLLRRALLVLALLTVAFTQTVLRDDSRARGIWIMSSAPAQDAPHRI